MLQSTAEKNNEEINKKINKIYEKWSKYFEDTFIMGYESTFRQKNLDKEKDSTLAKWREAFGNPVKGSTSIKVDPDTTKAFSALIEGQAADGGFSGLSFTVFPIGRENKTDENPDTDNLYAVTLNVGTQDYGNDYQLACHPGTRRTWKDFLQEHQSLCTKHNDIVFRIKYDLSDKNSDIDESPNCPLNYRSTTLAYAVIDYSKPEGKLMMLGLFAQYAKMRKWGKTQINDRRENLFKALEAISEILEPNKNKNNDDFETVKNLLAHRHFVVLQGAPGTGKTYLTKRLTKGYQTFFTQFHAETSYSDFVYGIQPKVQNEKTNDNLSFEAKEGILVKAIRDALKKEDKKEPVYLIIDEINRANLASVLGPAFYLFEYSADSTFDDDMHEGIEIAPDLCIKRLPSNLYVIATMNTADRSLAVVDFALRRRFAWYTMVPKEITLSEDSSQYFAQEHFRNISKIFDEYATDEELNLKPGHAYFIVPKAANESQESLDEKIKDRLRYEVMPLIKEYLAEGLISEAKNDFYQYFIDALGEEMFK